MSNYFNKSIFQKSLTCLFLIFFFVFALSTPAIAAKDDKAVSDYGKSSNEESSITETTFFGNVEDDGNGCGVWLVINIGLTILTYGVGIAATVGLVITAIIYITARDNASQLAKAKTRFFEIVVGLAIYAVMWGLVSWLIPGGTFNDGSVCSSSSSAANN